MRNSSRTDRRFGLPCSDSAARGVLCRTVTVLILTATMCLGQVAELIPAQETGVGSQAGNPSDKTDVSEESVAEQAKRQAEMARRKAADSRVPDISPDDWEQAARRKPVCSQSRSASKVGTGRNVF